MGEFDKGALQYVFPEELLRYFDIVESGIKLDRPTGEDYLEVVFEEKNELPEGYIREEYASKGFLVNVSRTSPCVDGQFFNSSKAKVAT